MPVTITYFDENTASRRGTSSQSTRVYTVAGNNGGTPITEAELSAYLVSQIGGVVPTTLNNLKIADASYLENEEIPGHFEVTINWDIPSELGYRFNFQAQGGHFVQSLQTISAWARGHISVTTQPLVFPSTIPNFGGAINVVPQEDGPPKVEGVDVQPPAETFSFTYYATDAEITAVYQKLVYNLCGKVNSTTFAGLDAGTTMLVRANGERKLSPIGHNWVIEFGFGYVPNLDPLKPIIIGEGISFGDTIHVEQKDGLDLLWVYREHEKENNYKILRPLAKAAYVERVWDRADLNTLNLPGI